MKQCKWKHWQTDKQTRPTHTVTVRSLWKTNSNISIHNFHQIYVSFCFVPLRIHFSSVSLPWQCSPLSSWPGCCRHGDTSQCLGRVRSGQSPAGSSYQRDLSAKHRSRETSFYFSSIVLLLLMTSIHLHVWMVLCALQCSQVHKATHLDFRFVLCNDCLKSIT